jgi:hypothetical protein
MECLTKDDLVVRGHSQDRSKNKLGYIVICKFLQCDILDFDSSIIPQ